MTVLNKSFTDQLTNTNQTTFLQKLLDLKLESNESIQHINERVISIVIAIQVIKQIIESKLTQPSSTSFLLKLLHIKLNDNESIQHYTEKAKNIVSNIQ